MRGGGRGKEGGGEVGSAALETERLTTWPVRRQGWGGGRGRGGGVGWKRVIRLTSFHETRWRFKK